MLASQIPAKFNIPFANSAGVGYIRTIPQSSQVSITPGAASLTDGFPPLTFTPITAGGVPMSGQDMNGILNEITDNQQWVQSGGMAFYDSAFSAAIGGYPNGAVLRMTNNHGIWVSTVDNNTTNPDASGAGWIPLSTSAGSYLSLSVAGSANVTLTTVQAATSIINLTGALTANINLIVPTATGEWLMANNTTGAFTVTVKTAAGTGIVATQGTANLYYCDGANVYSAFAGITQTQADARYAALAGSSAQAFIVANAASSNQATNLSQLGNYNAAIPTLATSTLASTCWGSVIQVINGSTITLPTSNPAAGSKVVLYGYGGGSGFTVQSNSNQFIYSPPIGATSTTGPTSITVPDGGWIEITARGSTEYDVTGGSLLVFKNTNPAFTSPVIVPAATANTHAVNLGQFTTNQVKTTTAINQVLPGGLILKSGYIASQSTGAFSVTFPTAFPTASVYVNYVGTANNAAGNANPSVTALSASGFSARQDSSGSAIGIYWFAIGY